MSKPTFRNFGQRLQLLKHVRQKAAPDRRPSLFMPCSIEMPQHLGVRFTQLKKIARDICRATRRIVDLKK